jgi:transcriptional regulator of aromatic amino acid metabolism
MTRFGTVANVLDDTARELGSRLADMARERAHTDAILTGMAEGVLLVNAAGRLVLTNPAGRQMLRLPEDTGDTHYVELVRQPDVCRRIAAALAGERPAPVEVQLDPGSRRIFIAHVVPVAGVRGGGAVLVLRDITDLRRRIRCGATSSRTSRTSCARRSRRSAATWRRFRTHRARRKRRASFSPSSTGTLSAWSGSCAISCGSRGSMRDRSP